MAISRGKDRELYRRIGYQVYRNRRRAGLTALVLARRAGVHENMIYRVESGLGISVRGLYRVAEALGVGIDVLVSFPPKVVGCGSGDELHRKKAAKVNSGSKKLF